MWGQVAIYISNNRCFGIIPTRVGTRISNNRVTSFLQDHPHACGDKDGGTAQGKRKVGSSPRVWGQVPLLEWKYNLKRIIPTRVGTSCPIISFSTVPKDHPHACGDKSLSAEINRSARGSSPRVWGQEIKSIVEAYAAGIIPTRVGTSHI